jgi:tetratricopeptide (TPR) repeat protein
MSDIRSTGQTATSERKSQCKPWGILGAVCFLVIGVYAHMAQPGMLESWASQADGNYYNLLVEGFRAHQLNLQKEAPPGLAQLADPYDPIANFSYQWLDRNPLGDLSFYQGKLYLYFGVTPALILFWPYAVLTGHHLSHREAATVFCVLTFLVSVGLLCALWRRYFVDVRTWVVAACAVALGMAGGAPVLLARSEVAISCGGMLTMAALAAIWCALQEPERRGWWMVAASIAYGLAVGARPSLLFGAAILVVPVVQAWQEQRKIGRLLVAAAAPIILIGLGLMLYNALRFDNPLEFGQRYQLAEFRQDTRQHFSLHYLWFNLRMYFLLPARWSGRFPFVYDLAVPPTPSSHGRFGILANIPLAWLALAAPLAWRGREPKASSILRAIVIATALFYGICALTLCLYYYEAIRFRMELLPALVLLSVVGILGLERALAHRLAWRLVARWSWGLLIGVSVAFNIFANVEQRAETHYNLGVISARLGRGPDAIGHYEQALQISPDDAKVHNNLGIALAQAGRLQEATIHFKQALQIDPNLFEVYSNLGNTLILAGKLPDAIAQWEQALRIAPDNAEVHCNLGSTFEQMGRTNDAVEHYRQALKLQPNMIEAQESLARLRVRR